MSDRGQDNDDDRISTDNDRRKADDRMEAGNDRMGADDDRSRTNNDRIGTDDRSRTNDDRMGADDDMEHRDRAPRGTSKWISAIIALAGLSLLAMALLRDGQGANMWNDLIIGLALTALGGYNYYRRSNGMRANTAAAGLVALLGLWLIVAPFVYGPGEGTANVMDQTGFWNDVIIGLITLLLGSYSVYEARERDTRTTPT